MKIIFGSNNAGKIREINSLLKDLSFSVVPQNEMSVTEAEETGLTFIENAIIKARHACHMTKLPALADDSGLVIPALQGAPGIYSARYASKEVSHEKNIAKVLQELQGKEDRRAYFYCVLAFMLTDTDPTPLICQGIWHGTIAETRSGSEGFGYDPIFFVPSENKTAAELPAEIKNRLSHRSQALQQLLTQMPEKMKNHVRTAS